MHQRLISWRAQNSELTSSFHVFPSFFLHSIFSLSHHSILSVYFNPCHKLTDIKWSNCTACWPNCFNREWAIPLSQTMSAWLQLIHSHSSWGPEKKLLQCLWCFSADKGIVGSEWRGWVDAALMWPRWAELERSAPFPGTVIKALKSTWEIHCIRKSLHYYQCTQCKHLIFMLITKTGWKYGKYINTHASYDCIRQEMIDESGYKWVRFVCAAVGRGMHTNLWFVDCRQHVLNTLPLWIMIWGSRQRKKKE